MEDDLLEIARPYKVCIIGSGNWASAICRIVGDNVLKNPKLFDPIVNEWVFEELINGVRITELINSEHMNIKYLPGIKLPENVVAIPDLLTAVKGATILIFCVPHQFLEKTCRQLKGNIVPSAMGISLVKGIVAKDTRLELISEMIARELDIHISVLMGANIANEVAKEFFCEATIASAFKDDALLMKKLFEADYFRITTVPDVGGVELCGALKNVVAVAAGISDGLGNTARTKATVVRLGFMEIIQFVELFHPGTELRTFYQSSGVADLIATCYGGRNHMVSKAYAADPSKSIAHYEQKLLNGQRLQGPDTAAEVNAVIHQRGFERQFPVFTAVHKICTGKDEPKNFISYIKNHPEFSLVKVDRSEFLPEPEPHRY